MRSYTYRSNQSPGHAVQSEALVEVRQGHDPTYSSVCLEQVGNNAQGESVPAQPLKVAFFWGKFNRGILTQLAKQLSMPSSIGTCSVCATLVQLYQKLTEDGKFRVR